MKIIQKLSYLLLLVFTCQVMAQEDALTILPNGNVGLGTEKPTQKLDVHGNVNVTGNINTQGNVQAKEVSVTGTITTQGNVGIGGDTAQKPLDISKEGGIRINRTESASSDNEILFADNGQIRSLDDNHRIIFDRENNIMEMREHGDIVFSPGAEKGIRTQKVTFQSDGLVGIGTSAYNAKLEIAGSGKIPAKLKKLRHLKRLNQNSEINYNFPSDYSGTIDPNEPKYYYSIFATNHIAAEGFTTFSDARIKNILGRSDAVKDLETLSKIEITDYMLIDSISNGNQTHKKVIAQQVKEVYPQAVSSDLTDVIPNIYTLSAIKDGWIQITTKELVVGDKLKLIFSEDETLVDVLEIQGDALKVASDQEGPVFVYGKQVSDFHTVDYEAIAMLNVSATQELLKRIETLSRKQKQLEDHLSASVSRIEKLETLFNNLK